MSRAIKMKRVSKLKRTKPNRMSKPKRTNAKAAKAKTANAGRKRTFMMKRMKNNK